MMPTRTLGRTGLKVTQLGYGSMGLRGPRTWGVRVVSDKEAEAILHAVLDAGINFIDTSPDYGLSEERIGQFLQSRRDEFVLATKCGCVYHQHSDHLEIDHVWDKEVVRGNLETSLRRMRTDHIDLLQFHGGDAQTLQCQGLIDLLQEFRRAGKIRFLGVSTKLPYANDLIATGVFDTIQLPYSCLSPEHSQCLNSAGEKGIGTIVRGGVAHGGPDAVIDRPALRSVWDRARLDDLCPKGMSRAELILRCTLSHSDCDTTIVGTCDPDHLAANVAAAARGPLPDSLLAAVTRSVASV